MSAEPKTAIDVQSVSRPSNLDENAAQEWSRYETAGQQHVFRFWDELDDSARVSFLEELQSVDLDLLSTLIAAAAAPAGDRGGELEPAPVLQLGKHHRGATREQAFERGEELLRQGKVGVFLVAGGQGSRLGFDGPKGCLPFGVHSERTLFELHAQKIRALCDRFAVTVPWYIMTSSVNNDATSRFFEENDYFGLSREDVVFLEQMMLPALDGDGKLVLSDKGKLFLSPNGHGGAYATFAERGGLEHARHRGIEHIFYYQVDNALIRIADPFFVGLHDITGAEMSLKVLEKTGPDEKLGVVGTRDGVAEVIEYSDLPQELAQERDEDGRLAFGSGSIAIHAFQLDFFERIATGGITLPYHVASKSLSSIDENGEQHQIDGTKFETFVFDALSSAERYLNVEVVREQEFAPVKNATGVDSLESAHALVCDEHRRWLQTAGIEVTGRVEISPLAALRAADCVEPLSAWRGKKVEGDVRVERDADGEVTIHVVT
jgi:UDP-N-acetylglucosamine/UDP-N-acetylgalactosamine diphosphorylase